MPPLPIRTEMVRTRGKLRLLLVLSWVLSVCGSVGAQTVAELTTLDFGSVLDSDGTVTLSLADTITSDPASIHLGGTVASGIYLISGTPNEGFKISVTGSSVSGLAYTPNPSAINNAKLDGSGNYNFVLGGNLGVTAAAAASGPDQLLPLTIAVKYKGNSPWQYFNFNGEADVFAVLGVDETSELDFGTVTDEDGTLTLGLADSITADANGISVGGSVTSGVYTVTGEPSQTVSVTLSGSAASGLTIGSFTTSEPDLGTVSLDGSGSNAITIGADLTVASATASPGVDQLLSFTFSVTYN